MEEVNQPELFRPPQTPFEVAVLIKQIFCNLGYADLQNCCLVSRTWNVSASKLLQELLDACRRVKCRLIPSEAAFGRALRNKEQLFLMENEHQLLELLRTRNLPGGHDSLPPFRFDCDTPECITNQASPLFHFGSNELSAFFSVSYDRTVLAFLTNPLLSDFVGSVTLNWRFADLEVVFEILTKLTNLKELKLKFEPNICLKILGGKEVPKCEATSTVQKLELELVRDSFVDVLAISERKIQRYILAILQVCIDLKSLNFLDRGFMTTDGRNPLDVEYLTSSLKNHVRIEQLEIASCKDEAVPSCTKPHPLALFTNLKSLDLLSWGRLSLIDWNSLVANGLAANLGVLCLRLRHTECPRQLVYFHSMAPGMNASGSLKHLILSLTWRESRQDSCDWYEEWNVVEEGGALTLTEARIVYDDTAVVDLKSFQNLAHLTLRVRKKTLAAALAAAPSAVKHLQITVATDNFILKLTDQELRSAVSEHFAAASTLNVFHVRQLCGYVRCSRWIIKHVYLNEEKKSRHVRELGLRIIGCGLTKRLTGSVSEETAAPCCLDWVSQHDEIIW